MITYYEICVFVQGFRRTVKLADILIILLRCHDWVRVILFEAYRACFVFLIASTEPLLRNVSKFSSLAQKENILEKTQVNSGFSYKYQCGKFHCTASHNF